MHLVLHELCSTTFDIKSVGYNLIVALTNQRALCELGKLLLKPNLWDWDESQSNLCHDGFNKQLRLDGLELSPRN